MVPLTRYRVAQVGVDALLIAVAWYFAFQLRFDGNLPRPYARLFDRTLFVVVGVELVVFVAFGFYNRWWRYVSTRDMWALVRGVTVASLVVLPAVYFWNPVPGFRVPVGVMVVDWIILLGLVTGSRLLARTIVEDDPRKRNLRVQGVRVIGTTQDLPRLLREHRPDELIIAIPSASGEQRQRIVEIARDEGIPVKTVPGLYELISDRLAGQIRPVEVEDVLGREPVDVDIAAVAEYLAGGTVL